MTTTTKIGEQIAARTTDAYSFHAFGKVEWARCAQTFLAEGYTEADTEKLLRSKIMRWAADGADEPYRANATDLGTFLSKPYAAGSIATVLAEAD